MVKSMSAVLVPLEEYLNTSYDPDREYVDGVVKERNAGEYPHSAVQSNFGYFLRQRYPRLRVLPEQRVRTTKSRTRIPDVIVVLERPKSRVIEAAPLICIEILSACDTMTDLMERLEEYAAMGVIHIWVADPSRRKDLHVSRPKARRGHRATPGGRGRDFSAFARSLPRYLRPGAFGALTG